MAVSDLFRNWNYAATDSDEYKHILGEIEAFMDKHGVEVEAASDAS